MTGPAFRIVPRRSLPLFLSRVLVCTVFLVTMFTPLANGCEHGAIGVSDHDAAHAVMPLLLPSFFLGPLSLADITTNEILGLRSAHAQECAGKRNLRRLCWLLSPLMCCFSLRHTC